MAQNNPHVFKFQVTAASICFNTLILSSFERDQNCLLLIRVIHGSGSVFEWFVSKSFCFFSVRQQCPTILTKVIVPGQTRDDFIKITPPLVGLEPTTFELEVQHASPLRHRSNCEEIMRCFYRAGSF